MTLNELTALLWRTNLSLVPTLAVLFAGRNLIRRHAGSDAVYILWLIVPAGLVAAVLPPEGAEASSWLQPPAMFRDLIEFWAAGTGLSLLVVIWRHWRLLRQARRGKIGPAVIGVISPKLYLPVDFERRFTPAEQVVIRAHERAHMQRWDTHVNAVVALFQILFWCNPLAFIAARLFREDQEMACDQQVMDIFPERRRLYAETMLKSQDVHWSPSLGCAWSRHPLESRIWALQIRPSADGRVMLHMTLIGMACIALLYAIRLYFPATYL